MSTTVKNNLQAIANKVAAQVKKSTPLSERKELLEAELAKYGFITFEIESEKPHRGASFFVKEMQDSYRINFRCGYGKHNYAPVIGVFKTGIFE